MDEEPRKEYKLPSMLEMFDKVQSQMNPLSYQLEKLNSIQGIANQYEHLNPAVNIVRKAVQPVDLASSSVVDHIAVAMNAQLRVPEAMAVQDSFLEMKKGMGAYNNSLMSVRESLIQSTGGTSVYENMMSSVNLIRDSLEPYRSTFDAVRTSFEASESFKLARELQSQVVLATSTLSKHSDFFEQFESLRNLEYFQSIFELNNFQFEEVVSTNLTQGDITRFTEKPISEIESDLSDEIKSGKGFSLYSDQDKKYLSYIYHYYLLPLFFGYLFLNMSNIIQAKEELKVMETKQEIRSFTRSSHTTFDRKALKGHRFVMVNLLNFRDRPSMNSNVIDSLPIGTTVRVLNKSERSWLLVEVEINGELEQGWVLRRYTTYFK
ncbi:SH3 domain-containing protein [Psychrobacter sp. SCQQ22]|uniref:SH3 domain-containing protein n=1 Tax=Psychrobacter sp. SCQQ22 TaxID=2792059 RepID=UPI0018CD2747|nr:SH3 domain-containing protein [Psychrobacter sp. SCQQ22]MBH0084688.1 SH3 domain-containing protein [Psychrobacter sp. SCQQ22]